MNVIKWWALVDPANDNSGGDGKRALTQKWASLPYPGAN